MFEARPTYQRYAARTAQPTRPSLSPDDVRASTDMGCGVPPVPQSHDPVRSARIHMPPHSVGYQNMCYQTVPYHNLPSHNTRLFLSLRTIPATYARTWPSMIFRMWSPTCTLIEPAASLTVRMMLPRPTPQAGATFTIPLPGADGWTTDVLENRHS